MKAEALAKLDAAYVSIVSVFEPMPDAALAWLKPGDDYAIGGIVIHLIQSLDGYIATLAAMEAAGYRDTEGPGEDEKAVDAGLRHARRGLAPEERRSVFQQLGEKQARLREQAGRASEAQFTTLVGVRYPDDDAPYPTSVALVLQWMTEHYVEHVPHAEQLFGLWRAAR